MKRQRYFQFTAAAGASCLLAMACFNGVGGASTNAHAKATKSPIIIGSEGPTTSPIYSIPNIQTAMQASVDEINAAGGVNGHPLKLDFCNTQFSATLELSCARTLVSEHIIAAVNPTIVADQSGAEFTLFANAHIAYFAGAGTSPTETSSADSFPMASGGVGWVYGALKALKAAGATKVAVMSNTGATGEYVESIVLPALTQLGMTNAGAVLDDPTADPTYSTSAAKVVSEGATGVFLATGNIPLTLTALAQAGYKGKLGTDSVEAGNAVLSAAGSAANGMLLSSQTAWASDTSNPAVKAYLAAMKKYEPKSAADTNGLGFYAGVQLFAKVAATSTAKTLTAAGFVKAASNVSKPINIGLIGPWATKGRKPEMKAFPRILNPEITVGVVKNGKIVPALKGFENPFTAG